MFSTLGIISMQSIIETLGEQQAQRQNAMQQDNMDRQHQRDMEKREQYNDYRLESQRINR